MSTINSWSITYRPKTFDEVIGQNDAVAFLKGAIVSQKIPKMLLITGDTGVGKTTLSYIFAAELNETTIDDNSDCRVINLGSNRNIDDMRALIQESQYLPRKNYSIICMEESHALTATSASTLLKPLEDETNKHVVWIFTTNYPDRMLPAIMSRASITTLRTPEPKEVVPLLQHIAECEGVVKIPIQFYEGIAKAAYGQPRAAIQLLQKAVTIIEGGHSPKDALYSAIKMSELYNLDEVAGRVIVSTYLNKPNIAIDALLNSKTNAPINSILAVNTYIIHRISGKNPSSALSRKEIYDHLKIKNAIPTLKKACYLHKALCEAKNMVSFATYSISELDALIATLGSLKFPKED